MYLLVTGQLLGEVVSICGSRVVSVGLNKNELQCVSSW